MQHSLSLQGGSIERDPSIGIALLNRPNETRLDQRANGGFFGGYATTSLKKIQFFQIIIGIKWCPGEDSNLHDR